MDSRPATPALKRARRHRPKARFTSAKDLRFFFDWELAIVGPATVILGALELNVVPSTWAFADWLSDWKLLIFFGAVGILVISPVVTRGLQHLRTREGYARRSSAQSFALDSISGRASNLVAKVRQVEKGERTKEYLAHTMSACHTYFRGRTFSGEAEVDGRSAKIDIVYYNRADASQTLKYEKLKTNDGSTAPFKVTVSTRQGPASREIVHELNRQVSLSPADFQLWAGAFLQDGHEYVTGIGVPVVDSPKDDQSTVGILIAVSNNMDALHATDREYLATQAWMISVSHAVESLKVVDSRTSHAVSRSSPVGVSHATATLHRGE